MTTRPQIAPDKVAPAVHEIVSEFHRNIVDEVSTAVARDPVVVVGMAQNPVVKNARKLLTEQGIKFTYLEYGSYLSKYRERLAIKLWSGYPLFPMVFPDGTIIGGLRELKKVQEAGGLAKYK